MVSNWDKAKLAKQYAEEKRQQLIKEKNEGRPRVVIRRGGHPAQKQTPPPQQAEQERIAKQQEQAKQQEEQAKQQAVEKERLRIEQFRASLNKQNAQTYQRNLIESETKQPVKTEVLINKQGERIYTKTNLTTGEVTTKTFERRQGISGVQQTGGIVETKKQTQIKTQTPKQDNRINPLSIQPLTIESFKGGYTGQSFLTSTVQSIKNLFSPSTYKESKEEKSLRLASVGSSQGTIPKETVFEKIIEPFKYTGRYPGDEPKITPEFGSVNINLPKTVGEEERLRAGEELILKGETDIGRLMYLYGETGTYKNVKQIPQIAETGLIVSSSLIPGATLPLSVALIGSGIKKGLDITQAEKEGVKISNIEKFGVSSKLLFGVGGVVSATSNIERYLIKELEG